MTPAPPNRWALAGLSLSMLMASLGTSIANVGLPAMGEAFGASFAEVQWIVLAYLLASTTFVVGIGRLGDIAGRRRLLLAGIALFTAASAAGSVAPTLAWLVAARTLQGLGAAAMMGLSLALVGQAVPKDRTGRAMGLLGTMSAVGTALGPTLGGMVVAFSGWQGLFLVSLPLGLLAFRLAYRHLPSDGSGQERLASFDGLGTALLGLSLGAYALAMTYGRGFGTPNAILLLAALVGAGVFLRIEAHAASPLVRLAMFRDSVLSAGLGMSLLVSTVVMTTLVVGPFHLSQGLGREPAVVGLTMSAGPVVAVLAGVPAGRLVDRLSAHAVTILGLLAAALGAALLSIMPAQLGIAGYAAPLVVLTGGYALFQAANNTAVMQNVSREQRGVVSGMLSLSRNLGLVTGASFMGAVFAWASTAGGPATPQPEAVVGGAHVTFGVAALLIVLALGIALGSRRAAEQSGALDNQTG